MLQLHSSNRKARFCYTGSAILSVQVISGQCAWLFYFLPTSSPGIIATGQQTHLPLHMFENVALDQHTSLKPNSYVCNSFTRLAGRLQYPMFLNVDSYTVGMFVVVVPECKCTSVTIKLDQHACLLEMQPDQQDCTNHQSRW